MGLENMFYNIFFWYSRPKWLHLWKFVRNMISTRQFSVAPSRLAMREVRSLAARWWWLPALPLLAAFVAGFADWRWWIAAAAILLVMFPALLSFAYYYSALSPESADFVLAHRVVVGDDGDIAVMYDDGRPTRVYKACDVVGASEGGGFFVIEAKSAQGGRVAIDIPMQSIEDEDARKELRERFGRFFVSYD